MTPGERYVWDVVHAAISLPRPSLRYAAHLLGVAPLSALPTDTRARLYGVLHALGDVEHTPAVDAFLCALRAGASASEVHASPHWHTLRLLRQDQHAMAALTFMQSIASAGVRRLAD